MNPLEFAVQMENDGEHFYRRQAEYFHGTSLSVVFLKLADAEHKHKELLEARLSGLAVELPDDQGTEPTRSVFFNLVDLKKKADNLSDQMDAYALAAGVEQRSIDLYTELLQTATDPSNKILLQFLLIQEREHLALFDGLRELLSRPKEWVEAAEFGPREEY
jgi:rubrerythrin